jgi:hypothetical protein
MLYQYTVYRLRGKYCIGRKSNIHLRSQINTNPSEYWDSVNNKWLFTAGKTWKSNLNNLINRFMLQHPDVYDVELVLRII